MLRSGLCAMTFVVHQGHEIPLNEWSPGLNIRRGQRIKRLTRWLARQSNELDKGLGDTLSRILAEDRLKLWCAELLGPFSPCKECIQTLNARFPHIVNQPLANIH